MLGKVCPTNLNFHFVNYIAFPVVPFFTPFSSGASKHHLSTWSFHPGFSSALFLLILETCTYFRFGLQVVLCTILNNIMNDMYVLKIGKSSLLIPYGAVAWECNEFS